MTPPPASEIVPDFVGSGPEGRRARALPGRAVTVSRSLGDSACAESPVSGDMSLTAESPSDPPLPHRRSPVGRPRYAQSCRTRSRRALRPDRRRFREKAGQRALGRAKIQSAIFARRSGHEAESPQAPPGIRSGPFLVRRFGRRTRSRLHAGVAAIRAEGTKARFGDDAAVPETMRCGE